MVPVFFLFPTKTSRTLVDLDLKPLRHQQNFQEERTRKSCSHCCVRTRRQNFRFILTTQTRSWNLGSSEIIVCPVCFRVTSESRIEVRGDKTLGSQGPTFFGEIEDCVRSRPGQDQTVAQTKDQAQEQV